ncbi:kinetochore Sim4 complex subunit FTA2-domain-containing protein [Whalleya microplaca]|nr:kinetochore Sim4 complex subunit FTA2-domain-containing protein [Whalleya microplaca]
MAGFPPVPGPKLNPFNAGSEPLKIEFIEHLGKGDHAHVWKVSINEKIYALKIFTFFHNYDPPDRYKLELTADETDAYLHPFGCECRAYARIRDVGADALVARCYGYLLLDQEQQASLRQADAFDWEKDWGYEEAEDAGKPLRALVKEFVALPDPPADGVGRWETEVAVSPRSAPRLISTVRTLHRSGILVRDISLANVIEARILEFSMAWTMPHPCLARVRWQDRAHRDACDVDGIIDAWNEMHSVERAGREFEGVIWVRMLQNNVYAKKLRSRGNRGEYNEANYGYRRKVLDFDCRKFEARNKKKKKKKKSSKIA